MPYFGDLAQYLVTLKLLASEDNKYQSSQIIERMNMTNNYIFSNSFFENFYIIMILVLLKKQNLSLIKEKPKILGFFIIIIFGGGADGFYHTNWLDDLLPHLQNCHNCMHHFEILCMALFCKMGSQLLQQQLNGQRDMLELCIFYVSQSTFFEFFQLSPAPDQLIKTFGFSEQILF